MLPCANVQPQMPILVVGSLFRSRSAAQLAPHVGQASADAAGTCAQVPTGVEVLSLVILTLGVVLSVWEGSIAGSPTGICIALASTVCGAAMLSFSGKVHFITLTVLSYMHKR